MSAEKIINTPATDSFGLFSDRVSNTEMLHSEGDGPNPKIRSLTAALTLWQWFNYGFTPNARSHQLHTIYEPCSAVCLISGQEVQCNEVGCFFSFIDLRNTFRFMRHTLHLLTSQGRITVRVPRKEKTSSEETRVQLPHGIISEEE